MSEKAQEIEWVLLSEGQQRNVLKVIRLVFNALRLCVSLNSQFESNTEEDIRPVPKVQDTLRRIRVRKWVKRKKCVLPVKQFTGRPYTRKIESRRVFMIILGRPIYSTNLYQMLFYND